MKKSLSEIINSSWNNHYVRKSRHHTPFGIPDQLFFLHESVHAENHGRLYQQNDNAKIERHVILYARRKRKSISYTKSIYFNIIVLRWDVRSQTLGEIPLPSFKGWWR